MQFLTTALLALGAVASAAPANDASDASDATSKTYLLKTALKPGQSGKSQYNNLYLTAYHSGAGLNDAVLVANKSVAITGSLKKTNSTPEDGHAFYNQLFKLGSDEYSLIPLLNEDFYAAWQPTAINVGAGIDSSQSGFWLNSTGLQWSSQPEYPGAGQFGGWFVCDWFRGEPQLFFTVAGEDPAAKIPCSCAHVNLVPEYK